MPPSWVASSTIVNSSRPVMELSLRDLNSRDNSFFHCANKKLTGVRIAISTSKNGAENMANASGDSLARLLGDTSPKISTTTVVTMVASVAPISPKCCTNSTVASEAIKMLTRLFPTRMVDSSLS